MLEQIMSNNNMNYLPRALTAATMRQEVISNNIANVNTPRFRKSDLEFEDLLAKEIYGDEQPEGKLQMTRTRDKHLPAQRRPFHAVPTIVEDESTIMRTDENNVDIDTEMANLTKNQLYFNAVTKSLNGHITKLKNVISSGQS